MTHANVGSLLVFDPSKLHLVCTSKDRCTNTSKDAVVGIITERGEPSCHTAFLAGKNIKYSNTHPFAVAEASPPSAVSRGCALGSGQLPCCQPAAACRVGAGAVPTHPPPKAVMLSQL